MPKVFTKNVYPTQNIASTKAKFANSSNWQATQTNDSNNSTQKNSFAKKLALIFVVAALTILFTGCANITYSKVAHSNGEISESIIVTLDEQKLTTAGVNLEQLKIDVKTHLALNFFKNANNFKQYQEGLATPESIQKAAQITTKIVDNQNNGQISATVIFANSGIMQEFNNWLNPPPEPNPDEQPNPEDTTPNSNVTITKDFFYITQTQKVPHVFTQDVLTNNALFDYYSQNYSHPHDLAFSTLTFSQIYGDSNLRLKSNATKTLLAGGTKLHVWEIKTPLLNQAPLEFYAKTPITRNWYAVSATLAVATGIVLAGVGYYLKFGNKQNNNKNVFKS